MSIKGKLYEVWPVAAGVGGCVCLLAFIMFMFFQGIDIGPDSGALIRFIASPVMHSVLFVWGLSIGVFIYCYGISFQKVKLRDEIAKTEEEFEAALFSLGNRLSSGIPMEKALRYAQTDTAELNISGLFAVTMKNMNRLTMTFHDALFDEKYGALRFYPSNLIRTIMKSVSASLEKGTKVTSTTMLTISEYLRAIHNTQEKIEDLLSSISSSMKFQAFVLVPVISGVVVATAQVIMTMILGLSEKMAILQADAGGAGEFGGFGALFASSPTPPHILQLVVGIYVLEILVLLGKFITKIEVGDDPIKEGELIAQVVVIGMIMYTVVLGMVNFIFGGMITGVLGGF